MFDHPLPPISPDCSLPFSDEAEKGALSALLQDPANLLPDFASHLPEEAFYHPANLLVYQTFQEMHRAGRPVEQLAVVSYMMDKGLLDRVGGAVTIVDLATYYGAGLHYRYYLELLRTKLMLRRLIATCKQGLEAAYAHPPDGDVLETVGTLERSVAELRMQDEMAGEGATFKELVNGAVDRYEQAILNGGQLPGVSTGYRRLDYATGGLREGQVWTLGGGTSDGKSAFMQNVVHSLAQQNVSTCLYSLEMSDEENVDRFMSMHSGVPAQDFLYGLTNRQHMTAATHAASSLQKWPLVLRDVSGISLSTLRSDMRHQVRRHGIRVFALDYLQLISPDRKGHSREREVAEISAALKADAKLLKVSILNLSQLNDEGKLRESRAIGQDSDVVGVLRVPVNDRNEPLDHLRELYLAKVRGGQRHVTLRYEFDGPRYLFREV